MITNKKIALIAVNLWVLIAVVGKKYGFEVTPEQLTLVGIAIGAFGVGDIGFDWIGLVTGNDSPSVPIGIGLPPEADTGDPAPIVPDVFPSEKKVG
jgi:hypothetical protein